MGKGTRGAVVRLESRWIDIGGLRMHARVSVDPVPAGAPVVVLVHGIGVSSRYMVPTAELLARSCRVYAPDLPGFGRSAKPPHVLRLTELTDALAAWMQAAGLARAAFLGNSFGCQILADFALRYPQQIERAVLVGPTIDRSARTAYQQLWRLLLDSCREPPAEVALAIHDYLEFGPLRFLRTFQYALQDRIEEKLPHVRVPTLVVRGDRDPIVPQRWAEEVTGLLPNGRLVVIPGAAHTVNYNAPLELVRVLRPFLGLDRQANEEAGR